LFEISGAGARDVQIGFRLAARWRTDDAGVEKTPARSACPISPGLIKPTFSIFIFPVASFAAHAADRRPSNVKVAAATPATWRNPRRFCSMVMSS